jgi:flagellar hook-associated protein 3 FlgL
MKTSFVSTSAISQAMRYQMLRMQADLVKAEQEMVSLRVADPGLKLGARTAHSVSLTRDIDRLNGLVDSNALVSSRLSSTQQGLSQMTALAESLLPTLTTALGGPIDPNIPRTEANAALGTLTSLLNSSQGGEYLFAGINTDVKPVNDFTDPASASRTAFDTAFSTHFGFAITDPAAASISPAAMTDFIDTVLEQQFLGAGWQGTWSNATDEKIVARITLSETTPASISANVDGVRKLAMGVAMVAGFMEGAFSEQTRQAVLERSAQLVAESVADLGATQGELGIMQQRVESASQRISMQVDLFQTNLQDLEGVDAFEVSTRVSSLLAQIETSYTLTARIQQLSLVRFLS